MTGIRLILKATIAEVPNRKPALFWIFQNVSTWHAVGKPPITIRVGFHIHVSIF